MLTIVNSALANALANQKEGSPILNVKGLRLKKNCVATLGLFTNKAREGYGAIITLFPSNDDDDCGGVLLDKGSISFLSPRSIATLLSSPHLFDLASLYLADEEMTLSRVFSALLVCASGDNVTVRRTEKGYEFEVQVGTATLCGTESEEHVGHFFRAEEA